MYIEPRLVVADPLGGSAEDAPVAVGFSPEPETLEANHVVGFGRTDERVHPYFVMRSHLLKHARATGQR
ncbi:MAG: hypothetical protein ABW194_01530, partial [Novosphingobium sp.]